MYMYTDGQKKRYNRILSGKTCGSQTRAARAYHDQKHRGYLNLSVLIG